MKELPDLTALSHSEKDALIHTLWDMVHELRREVVELKAEMSKLQSEVTDLRGQLAKNSRNSSKPPGSDGYAKPPPKSLRKPSGRSAGGQPGHKGSTLERSEHPDETVIHPLPQTCDACGMELDQVIVETLAEGRQVFDLPPMDSVVTEHRVVQGGCTCGKVHRSTFPEGVVGSTQYGPRVKAFAVDLTQNHMVSADRAAEIIQNLYGLRISPATVLRMVDEAQERLSPTVEKISQAICGAPVAHADETGMRVAGKLHWMHTLATPIMTWLGVHAKRGHEAIEAFALIPVLLGTLIHDGLAAYRQYTCQHGLCNAHHLRELTFIAEQSLQAWAQRMIDLLCQANDEVIAAQGKPLPQPHIDTIRVAYLAILTEGETLNPPVPRSGQRGRTQQSFATNLLRRLRLYADDVLRFTVDPHVPFTNNLAEQAIRMCKVKQKVSGCFRTVPGAEAFCTIRSYVATLKKQGINPYHALVSTFQGNVPQPRFA
jgi:transposase